MGNDAHMSRDGSYRRRRPSIEISQIMEHDDEEELRAAQTQYNHPHNNDLCFRHNNTHNSIQPVTPDTSPEFNRMPAVLTTDSNQIATEESSDDSMTEEMSSVSSLEQGGPMHEYDTSVSYYASDGQRQRNKSSSINAEIVRDISPKGVEDLEFDFQHKNPESKRLLKKRSAKSAFAKRLSFTTPRRKGRGERSLQIIKKDGVPSTTLQIIMSLSLTFIVLLIFIYSALSNIAKEIVETTAQSMHPQVEVADLVDQRFKMLEKKLSAKTEYTQPTMLDALAHSSTKKEKTKGKGSVTAAAGDYDPVTISAMLGTDKPLNEVTYEDLNFQKTTEYAPSCSAPLATEDMAFTFVTQVSEDRLWMLTQHCQRWKGTISAAVFTDLPASQVSKAITQESSVYGKCEEGQVNVQTFGKATFGAEDYPVNALRNMALRGVQTSHFFYADIDFWASEDLYDALHTDFMKEQMAADPKMALVVPAFQMSRVCTGELECRAENILQMPYRKEALMNLVREHKASAFDPTNRGGHGSTSYGEWFRMEDGDLWDIPCILSNRYEPYIAARYCAEFPPYQEQFSGYGKNKMTHIMQLRHSGYVFSQVGGVFVVHYPHLSSPTRKAWNHGKKKHDELKKEEATGTEVDWTQFKRGQVDKVFVEFRRWLEADVEDESRVPMCPDALNDDEKLWI